MSGRRASRFESEFRGWLGRQGRKHFFVLALCRKPSRGTWICVLGWTAGQRWWLSCRKRYHHQLKGNASEQGPSLELGRP